MDHFVNMNMVYFAKNENFLPKYMLGSNMRKLEYPDSEIVISIVALDTISKTAKIKKLTKRNSKPLIKLITKNPIIPDLDLYQINLGNLKGRGIVQFSSERMDIIILIIDGPLLPEEFIESFKNFNLSKPGFIADRLKSILKSL